MLGLLINCKSTQTRKVPSQVERNVSELIPLGLIKRCSTCDLFRQSNKNMNLTEISAQILVKTTLEFPRAVHKVGCLPSAAALGWKETPNPNERPIAE